MKTVASDTKAVEGRRGVLVLGTNGKTLAASGIALQEEVATRMASQWRTARSNAQTAFSIEGLNGTPVVVVALPTPGVDVLVAMQREGRDALFELVGSVEFAGEILAQFLTNPFAASVIVDRNGILRYLSPVHERFLGLQPGSAVGQHVTRAIENSGLHQVAATGKADIGVLCEVRGETRVVSRRPVRNSAGEIVGAIGQVMFRGPEQLQALSDQMTRLKSQVAYYQREVDYLRNRSYGLDQIVGGSQAVLRLKQQIIKVAPLDVPVLLTGESGTGKELAAHAIHKLSARRDAPMVMINAGALPPTLVESELFGYEGGSFTGAERKGRKGKFEQADGGTLFLDEIGDMPADVQVKVLRVLQDGTFQRVGGNELRRSSFRLVSASNRNFETMIREGEFRLDLFYRIGGVTIRLPALRERLDDIAMLAELALKQFARQHGLSPKRLSSEAIDHLGRQSWPGNVRQLMHTVERAAIFSDGEVIMPGDLGLGDPDGEDAARVMSSTGDAGARPPGPDRGASHPVNISSAVEKVEEQMIRQAMARFRGNKKRVAEELGISRSYLYKRLAGMSPECSDAGPRPDLPKSG